MKSELVKSRIALEKTFGEITKMYIEKKSHKVFLKISNFFATKNKDILGSYNNNTQEINLKIPTSKVMQWSLGWESWELGMIEYIQSLLKITFFKEIIVDNFGLILLLHEFGHHMDYVRNGYIENYSKCLNYNYESRLKREKLFSSEEFNWSLESDQAKMYASRLIPEKRANDFIAESIFDVYEVYKRIKEAL